MTDSRTLGQRVPKEGLFLMDGIEGLRSLPKHSVDMLLTDPPYGTIRNYWDAPGAVGGGEMGSQAEWRSAVFRTVPL